VTAEEEVLIAMILETGKDSGLVAKPPYKSTDSKRLGRRRHLDHKTLAGRWRRRQRLTTSAVCP